MQETERVYWSMCDSKFLIDSECGCEGDSDVCMRVFGRVSGGVRILSLDGDSDDE